MELVNGLTNGMRGLPAPLLGHLIDLQPAESWEEQKTIASWGFIHTLRNHLSLALQLFFLLSSSLLIPFLSIGMVLFPVHGKPREARQA
jgi:hypothetical protein